MTKAERTECKRFAQAGLTEEMGNIIPMSKMALLEVGGGDGKLYYIGNREFYIDYVMIEDVRTGRQYQITYSVRNYTIEHQSLWRATEYIG